MEKQSRLPVETENLDDRLALDRKLTSDIENLKRRGRILNLQVKILQDFNDDEMQKILDSSAAVVATSPPSPTLELGEDDLAELTKLRGGAFSYDLEDLAEERAKIRAKLAAEKASRKKLKLPKIEEGIGSVTEETDMDLAALEAEQTADMKKKRAEIAALMREMDTLLSSIRQAAADALRNSGAAGRVIQGVAQYQARAPRESGEAKKSAEEAIKHAGELQTSLSRAERIRNSVEERFLASGRSFAPGITAYDNIIRIAKSGIPGIKNEQARAVDLQTRVTDALQAATQLQEDARSAHIESVLRDMESNISRVGLKDLAELGEAPEFHSAGNVADEAERLCPDARKETEEVRRHANTISRVVGLIRNEKQEINSENARMMAAMERVRIAMRRDLPNLVQTIEAEAQIVQNSSNQVNSHLNKARKLHAEAVTERGQLDLAYEKAIDAQMVEYKHRAEDYLKTAGILKSSVDHASSQTDKLSQEAQKRATEATRYSVFASTAAKVKEVQELALKIQQTSQSIGFIAANAAKNLSEVQNAVSDIGKAIQKKDRALLNDVKNHCETAKSNTDAIDRHKGEAEQTHKTAQDDLAALDEALREARKLYMAEIRRKAEEDIAAARAARNAADTAATEANRLSLDTKANADAADLKLGRGMYSTPVVQGHILNAQQQANQGLQFSGNADAQAKIAAAEAGRANDTIRLMDEAILKENVDELLAQADIARKAHTEAVSAQHAAEGNLDHVKTARNAMLAFRKQAEEAYCEEIKRRVDEDMVKITKSTSDVDYFIKKTAEVVNHLTFLINFANTNYGLLSARPHIQEMEALARQNVLRSQEAHVHFDRVTVEANQTKIMADDVARAYAAKDLDELEAIAKGVMASRAVMENGVVAGHKILAGDIIPNWDKGTAKARLAESAFKTEYEQLMTTGAAARLAQLKENAARQAEAARQSEAKIREEANRRKLEAERKNREAAKKRADAYAAGVLRRRGGGGQP